MSCMVTKKIIKTEIDSYEFSIAKWGVLELKGRAYPRVGGFRYMLYSNGEKLLETNYLDEAIEKYNEYAGG